jgi:hypothetical protein
VKHYYRQTKNNKQEMKTKPKVILLTTKKKRAIKEGKI